MSLDNIKLGIKKWIQGELKLTVMFAEQSGPRPSKLPYVTIRLDSPTALGGADEQGELDDDGNVEVRGHRTLTVALDTYGPGALSIMETLQQSLGKVSVLDILSEEYGLAVIDTMPIQNLTALLETEFEERAHMDLIVGYAKAMTDHVGIIEHVEINDKIIDIN